MRSSSLGFVFALVALLVAIAPAEAAELIRYRRADGSVGFAGSTSSVPAGAVILTREPTSKRATDPAPGAHAPAIDELVSAVRRHCEAAYPRGLDDSDFCIADQTRAAFQFRDLMLEQRSGTEAFGIIERCRRKFERGRVPDYDRLLDCAQKGQAEFEARTGQHPAEIDLGHRDDGLESKRRAAQHRLRRMRDEQAATDRELAIGRDQWGPRYRKAEREYQAARTRTESILERMRNRGCRPNTLACGGLGPQLEAARSKQEEKRRYLEVGLREECRLAGCQPGWLR